MKRSALLIVAVTALDACTDRPQGGDSSFAIAVAPLQLPDVTEACYALTVTNGPADDTTAKTVWTKPNVCSTRYGDGAGSIAYVGTCDASVAPKKNTVSLVLTSLTSAVGPVVFDNPCPDTAPCRVEAACAENADTPVTFDLTILRPAQQGFFDIAVNFDDIFCSAKLDCVSSLLTDDQGIRGPTTVVGFACTAGPGQQTTLYWGHTAIVCHDDANNTIATYSVDPSQPSGQHGAIAATPPRAGIPAGIFQSAIYRGVEDLPGIDKCYWNLALGLNPTGLGPRCTFEATATAASQPLTALIGGTGVLYPVIQWSVPITNETGDIVCAEHPLNVPGSNVATTYVAGSNLQFQTQAACGADPTPVTAEAFACAPMIGGQAVDIHTDAQGRFFATYDGQTVGPLSLPPGTRLADTCCADACCAGANP